MRKILSALSVIILLQSVISCNNSSKEIEIGTENFLISNTENKASCVFLTTDENGYPAISWVEKDSNKHPILFFALWDEAKNTFGEKQQINLPDNTSVHEEGMPKIAFKGDGIMIATYESSVPVEGKKWGISDLSYMESKDKGKTWTVAQSVFKNKYQGSSPSFSGLSRLSDGEIGVAWLDNDTNPKNFSRPVFFAKTLKSGGFDNAYMITPKACQCCRIAISSEQDGQVSIAFRDLSKENVRDISVATSNDNGKSFQAPSDFSKDGWVIDGCPHNGPSIASSNGKTYLTWFTGGDHIGVNYGELNKDGTVENKTLLSKDGRFAQLSLLNDGTPVVVYSEDFTEKNKNGSQIKIAKMHNDQFVKAKIDLSGQDADYPVIRTLNDHDVIVAWSDNNQIFYKKIDISAL
ncbi:MAG: exo-alpha-sialidase [Chitinophagales bacterium]|nr:exo-alpha-sialidase [Chitinophagales bacterium]